jgi:dihydrofolate reductase
LHENYLNKSEEIFVIGGGEIYSQVLKYTLKIYVTKIYKKFLADTYFSSEYLKIFNCNFKSGKKFDEDKNIFFEFKNYFRIKF